MISNLVGRCDSLAEKAAVRPGGAALGTLILWAPDGEPSRAVLRSEPPARCRGQDRVRRDVDHDRRPAAQRGSCRSAIEGFPVEVPGTEHGSGTGPRRSAPVAKRGTVLFELWSRPRSSLLSTQIERLPW